MISQTIRGFAFFIIAGVCLLGVTLITASNAGAQTSLSSDGISFPDGTEQTTAAPVRYSIRDIGPGGGLVFYVSDGGAHGLEAAPADQSTSAQWGCVGSPIFGADGLFVGSGAQNTADILSGCNEAGIAASLANNYEQGEFSDWFLPTKLELDLMYKELHLFGVGGFASVNYWSSSEANDDAAWLQYFLSGAQNVDFKGLTVRVRAVRAF